MRIFSVNKGIGFASSGVEYAQKYRRELLEELKADDYYIYLNYISKNIVIYTDLMEFPKNKILSIYNYLSERRNNESTYRVEDFLTTILDEYEIIHKNNESIRIKLKNKNTEYKIWLLKSGMIDRIDYVENSVLIRVYHYDDSLNNFEEYQKGVLVRRVFFKNDGKQAFEQYYEKGQISMTFIDGKILYGKYEFYQELFDKLQLKTDDVILIDRGLDVVEGLLPKLANKARLMSVVHAEHYNEPLSDSHHILWNNNYQYVFDHAEYFDSIIVSTERQNQVLRGQLKHKTNVVTIPVGYVDNIINNRKYDPYRMVTASRLAREKHIDVIVKAVVKAKSILPDLSLDIYGEGGERNLIQNIIDDLDANNYVHLLGHKKMNGIYGQYGAYISASTSEGFGLSLLEAISESLPIIGVDVDYGNREFIMNDQNGVLYPRTEIEELDINLEQAILDFYSNKLEISGRSVARKKAKQYLKNNVSEQWGALLGLKREVGDEN
ncbi:glycosyl transferase, group 1 family protein [Weissella koreensis KACC 15510]|uniref:glycosyltransferase n=1 Tax=Weissella koreensis TaxID=165096 RepID=UPI000217587A|nr:glycosyltransferase [Weissella koreensis]AEJ22923.1 glycosyl transferase, group 1 family protein [Weissella koreensis KACC 15510]